MEQQEDIIMNAVEATASTIEDSDLAASNELPADMNKLDFQTIKAASDTLKVSIGYIFSQICDSSS